MHLMPFNMFNLCQYAQRQKLNNMKYNTQKFEHKNFPIYSILLL